jgi:hypothetical protein
LADFMRDLPLSWGEHPDESNVSSDWRELAADVLNQAAALIDASEVGEATLEWLATDFERTAIPRRRVDADSDDWPDGSAEGVRALARDTRAGRPVSVRLLARIVAAYLQLARELDAKAQLAARTSGAVALYLAAKAPTPIRAVTRGHTLRARDAGWEFGRGTVLEDDAVPMIEFLLGRSDHAPSPLPPHPHPHSHR